ncbi:DUF1566 domain-containing protein [Bathymodiolus thermophilus thioautotrophic gill symbiont]|uniref:Lcl C-terminal domain-containing protein n=1 Tax=Bathymodiolus thermophilus thioautotrophic gill symbiont TaxID=2360 RepID=A0A8H8XEX5_9GAMM|nr:DUF1566 domain-containing protein [Bathymodiolus thermophilus thioautotrophic gill symbiont]CAB5504022.1 hypothetical protein THERMOS_1882 [Bathymodiolus thermophilus thioautotrophic gill symbiont]
MKKTILFLTINIIFLATNYSLAQTCQDYIPNEWEDGRYVIRSDNTVIDYQTNLMWKKCIQGLSGDNCSVGLGGKFNWEAALQLAKDHNFATYSDWRLPNIKELNSLVTRNCYNPRVNESIFPNTPADLFWSSSPSARNSSQTWQLHFNYGYANTEERNSSNYVRLVRSR